MSHVVLTYPDSQFAGEPDVHAMIDGGRTIRIGTASQVDALIREVLTRRCPTCGRQQ